MLDVDRQETRLSAEPITGGNGDAAKWSSAHDDLIETQTDNCVAADCPRQAAGL